MSPDKEVDLTGIPDPPHFTEETATQGWCQTLAGQESPSENVC